MDTGKVCLDYTEYIVVVVGGGKKANLLKLGVVHILLFCE